MDKNDNALENLKAENEFLKLQLMLETGAQFGKMELDNQLTPDMENEFLNYVMEYEKQSQKPTYITVFDKIGRPTAFKPSAQISDEKIDEAWQNLSDYLLQYQIQLSACSPNISTRELYRFTLEELFKHEMSDMHIPGMMHCFIYDEFHPDHVYDNDNRVQDDLFPDIFRKEAMQFDYGFAYEDIGFNNRIYKDYDAFKDAINHFKSFFEEITLEECSVFSSVVEEEKGTVKGKYKASAISATEKVIFEGKFTIDLILNSVGFHSIKNICIEGITVE